MVHGLSIRQFEALRSASEHIDRMALTGVNTARVLVKRGLAESYGSGRICITERGEDLVVKAIVEKQRTAS